MHRLTGVKIQFEPSDHSVGIMSETFAAWATFSNDKDQGLWCELVDMITWKFRWEDSETGKDCAAPYYAGMVEKTLKEFVMAYYDLEAEFSEDYGD